MHRRLWQSAVPRAPARARGLVSGTTAGVTWANAAASSAFWCEPSSSALVYTALGTVSASATPFRGAPAGVLRLPGGGGAGTGAGGAYLFDCGEGTVGRLRDCYLASAAALRGVFLTHLHGDHCLGLPAVLYQWLSFRHAAAAADKEAPAAAAASGGGGGGSGGAHRRLQIFGPVGVLELVRAAFPTLRARARAELPLDVIELVGAGSGSGGGGIVGGRPQPAAARAALHAVSPVGRYRLQVAESNGTLRLIDDSEHSVVAAPVLHSTTCFGFVVTGKRRRHLLPDAVRARGVPAGEAYRRLVETGSVAAPDGSTVRLEDVSYLGPRPTKFALLGDNYEAPPLMKDLAQGADVRGSKQPRIQGARAMFLPPLPPASLLPRSSLSTRPPSCRASAQKRLPRRTARRPWLAHLLATSARSGCC